jgi:hypothetical protein
MTTSPRIARIWRGRTRRAVADDYAVYLYEHGIRPLEEKAVGVQLFREDRETDSEFVTISYWESVEAMSRFAAPGRPGAGDHRQPWQSRRQLNAFSNTATPRHHGKSVFRLRGAVASWR